MGQSLADLRERWQDPLLTVLTILLALLMFVLAPLRAEHIPGAQELGFALVAVVTGAVLILSGKRFAIWALLTAILLAAIAAIHRQYMPSMLDVISTPVHGSSSVWRSFWRLDARSSVQGG
jgi:uncharacterized membrane protein